MRNGLPLLALAAVFLLCTGCAATRPVETAAPAETRGGEVRVYEVFGMNCPGCHGGIEKLVLRIAGVRAAEANWEQKKLTVTLHPGAELDDRKIHEAIRKANFTLGERLR